MLLTSIAYMILLNEIRIRAIVSAWSWRPYTITTSLNPVFKLKGKLAYFSASLLGRSRRAMRRKAHYMISVDEEWLTCSSSIGQQAQLRVAQLYLCTLRVTRGVAYLRCAQATS